MSSGLSILIIVILIAIIAVIATVVILNKYFNHMENVTFLKKSCSQLLKS